MNGVRAKGVLKVFRNLFGAGDPFPDFNRERKPTPLKRPGDVNYEIQWRTADIENDGHKVIHVDQTKHGETVMIYQILHDDGLDDRSIYLRIKVITSQGVKTPDSQAYLFVYPDPQRMRISDIKIEGERVSRGYGSILMTAIMQLVDQLQVRFITGMISNRDWDHIERSEYFYRKFGFEVELNHDTESGRIVWINHALGATREELEMLHTDGINKEASENPR